MTAQLLAALSWDPQIRGALIVITAVLILPGSVYLLLATNTGAKLGFLIAAAGLTGWMATMGWIWVVYGIGLKGDPPTWHPHEIVAGDVAESGTTSEVETFPNGWVKLETGDPLLGDATASADKALVPADVAAESHGGEATAEPTVSPVFDEANEYVFVGGYAKGGENFWIPGGGLKSESEVGNSGSNPASKLYERLKRGPFHAPHYAVIQVQPVKDPNAVPVEADPEAPVYSVVMVRDLGFLRKPSLLVAIAMSLVFGILANALHRRDKEIMAARRTAPATA
jgi:hypothetical protein